AQFGIGGGMEHQTITSVSNFDEQLLVHELAHQWFGDDVTCKTWNDIWLNESFATYSEGVYYEGEYGKERYNSFINQEMAWTKWDSANSVYVNDISDVSRIFNINTSYEKGGIILHMLRGIVGDSTFFKILRTYISDPRYAYNTATTSDFQGIAESVSGLDLNYFFDEWIYGVNYPRYNLRWNFTDNGGGIYKIAVNISQTPGSNPQYFTMPVQLKVITNQGDSTVTVFNNKLEQEFDILVTGKPSNVIFDPDNLILKDLIITDVRDEKIPNQYKLEQNYPNPFNPKTTIRYSIPVNSFVTIKVYDVLGKEIRILLNERKSPGGYSINFNSDNLPSGVYFYSMQAGSFTSTKKFVLLK
ncbi:MAG: M1 family aminopeptidase, partial [Ignavibacteriaceae bacterium]